MPVDHKIPSKVKQQTNPSCKCNYKKSRLKAIIHTFICAYALSRCKQKYTTRQCFRIQRHISKTMCSRFCAEIFVGKKYFCLAGAKVQIMPFSQIFTVFTVLCSTFQFFSVFFAARKTARKAAKRL